MERRGDIKKSKRGQVWVETVVYTLVAFAIIGAVLAFVKPKIDELKDRAIIEQSLDLMRFVDSTITQVAQSPSGERRILEEVIIRKGSLKILPGEDEIIFEIDSNYKYSEIGSPIKEFGFDIVTEEKGKDYKETFSKIYESYDFEGEQTLTLTQATTSYKLAISNKGKDSADPTGELRINFEII